MAKLQTVKFGCMQHRSQGRNKVREYVCVFWEIAKSGYPDPNMDVAFLRCDKTVRVDPTFWFFNFLLVT